MTTDEQADDRAAPVTATRRIAAPAPHIFELLVDPRRHVDTDGSDMLRRAVTDGVITGVGDVFTIQMYNDRFGDYQMVNRVVAFEADRRIGWEPALGPGHPAFNPDDAAANRLGHRWSYELTPDGTDATVVTEIYDCADAPAQLRANVRGGQVWLESMERTLARLDELCAPPPA